MTILIDLSFPTLGNLIKKIKICQIPETSEMSDLLVVALLFQTILWQASFVAVAIDTTQVTGQRTLSDSNSTRDSQLFLNGHLYKTDSLVKLVPAFLYSLYLTL